jgi:hypothetical protein
MRRVVMGRPVYSAAGREAERGVGAKGPRPGYIRAAWNASSAVLRRLRSRTGCQAALNCIFCAATGSTGLASTSPRPIVSR